MQYRVNLAQADVINMNNWYYSKECLEQIKSQINKKQIIVYDEAQTTPNKQIGKTIKAEIIDDCLYADINLFKPPSANFINLSITGRLEIVTTVNNLWVGGKAKGVIYDKDTIQHCMNHYEVKKPEIISLFVSDTYPFSKDKFKTSNFVKQGIIFNNE
jgi:hypothetical protein